MSLHVLMYAACYLSSRHVLMWLESGYFASTYPVAFRAWLFVVFAFGSGRSPKKKCRVRYFFRHAVRPATASSTRRHRNPSDPTPLGVLPSAISVVLPGSQIGISTEKTIYNTQQISYISSCPRNPRRHRRRPSSSPRPNTSRTDPRHERLPSTCPTLI